jgi:hypothetical protein
MANTNSPFGFKWQGLNGGTAAPTAGLVKMKISSGSDASQYGEGDPLKKLNTGYVTAFTKGTAVSQLAGIFKACEYYNTALGRRVWSNYYPGSGSSGDVDVYVVPCIGTPNPQLLVQSAGAVAVGFGDIGQNTDILSGSSTTGTAVGGYYRSACSIDLVANFTTTATLPFRIVGLWSDVAAPGAPGTDNTTPFNWVLVEANGAQETGI